MPDDPAESSPVVPDPSPEGIGATGLPSNVAAALAIMIPLIGGVIFLFLERKDRLVRFYSIQSIVLGVLLGAAALMLSLVDMIFTPIPIMGKWVVNAASFVYGIFALFWLVLYFIALVSAFAGRLWAIPYLGPMAKRYLSARIP
jgi:uncharacterized membrane protein